MESLLMTPKDVAVAIYRPQPGTKAVAVRRAMLSIPAVMESLDNIERAVFIATTDVPFSDYQDNAIFGVMADSLKWIAKDVGIRDTESEDWKVANVRISQIVKRYYPTFTIKDVKMAFEMTVTGELNNYFPKDRNGNPEKDHFQMFNVDYFCKVMNAYRMRRNEIIHKANKAVPEPERERDPKREMHYRNVSRRDTIQAFLKYKYRGVIDLSPIGEMLAYDNLANVGLADPVNVTEREQQAILADMLAEFSRKQMVADKAQLKRDGIKAEQIQFPAYRLARRNALKATFDWMIKEEIQITDYIKLERWQQESK